MTEAQEFETSVKRAYDAHDKLLQKLFGYVPKNPGELTVSREDYTVAMEAVQKETGLIEGDPDLVLFVLEQLSRSPKFSEKKEVKASE